MQPISWCGNDDQYLLRTVAMRHKDEILSPYDAIIEMDGFEAVCAFCDLFGGATVYIPNKRKIFQRCLELEAMKEFDGGNYMTLKQKYGFSVSHLRKFINEK